MCTSIELYKLLATVPAIEHTADAHSWRELSASFLAREQFNGHPDEGTWNVSYRVFFRGPLLICN